MFINTQLCYLDPHPHGIGFDHIMHLQLAGENDPVTPSHTPISVSTTHADIALPYSPLSGFPESPSFVVSPTDTPPFQYNDTSTERYESAPNLLDKSNTFRMDVSTPAILRASELRRTVAARYVCKHCHKTFTTKQNLKYHHNVHFGRKEFVCSVCKKAFTTPTDVKRHGKKLHRFQFVRVEPNERSSASFTYCALSCGL
ncbi:hypothetical protein FPV67DRAFT_916425 [Lyophyllum atratum]|nr:hypothetical protein FPV67DRAFT_916425 [Lyophyllum atratum]